MYFGVLCEAMKKSLLLFLFASVCLAQQFEVKNYGIYAKYSQYASCTTTAGSPTVTLNVLQFYQNGEYATCMGAGGSSTAVAVSPSVASGVNPGGPEFLANPNGSTTYGYAVVAEDKHNGRTAASPIATTTKGAVSNGMFGCVPTAWTRKNQTVTLTVNNCLIVAGQQIWLNNALIGSGLNYDPISYGNWVAVAPTNRTMITFNTNYDTRLGAATGGSFKTYTGAISSTSLASGLASVKTNNSGFLAGESITITGTSNGGGVFNGTWQLASVSGPVVSFYIPNALNVTSASDSGVVTLDNVWGWRQNRITWPHNPGNYRYQIYGPFCPKVCNWMGQTVMDYFDDFGLFMEANQEKPPYIPNSPPSSGANQAWTFRIQSGGGTLSMTATTKASASVSGNWMASDDGPAFHAAAAAAHAFNPYASANVHVSPVAYGSGGGYTINSYTDLSQYNTHLALDGAVVNLNQPIAFTFAEGTGTPGLVPSFSFGLIPASGLRDTGAYPAVELKGMSGVVRDLSISTSIMNGYLLAYTANPINWTIDGFLWGASNNFDCTGVSLLVTTVGTGSVGFFNHLRNGTVFAGSCGASFVGSSVYPSVIETANTPSGANSATGFAYVENAWLINRGGFIFDTPPGVTCGGQSAVLKKVWTQNLNQAALSFSGIFGLFQPRVEDGLIADFHNPYVTSYLGLSYPLVIIDTGLSYTGPPVHFEVIGNSAVCNPTIAFLRTLDECRDAH